ncbi:uncharacterized protein LOC131078422 [Cryptomeria japonica]|uniref:uncharacterized protein LOC131078422 n=1 Tax=Cryptomeria japonica TaxID=3369 RepID=UPI0027DA9D08|nr:uncharacterized protein LOC131078422 [Cryptomeria japonica]
MAVFALLESNSSEYSASAGKLWAAAFTLAGPAGCCEPLPYLLRGFNFKRFRLSEYLTENEFVFDSGTCSLLRGFLAPWCSPEKELLQLPANVVVGKLLANDTSAAVVAGIRKLPATTLFSPLSELPSTESSKAGLPELLLGSASRCVVNDGISCTQNKIPVIKLNANTCKGPSFQTADKRLLSQLPERTEKDTKSKPGKGSGIGGSSRKRSREEKPLLTAKGPKKTHVLVKRIALNDPACMGICNEKSTKSKRKHGQVFKVGEKRSGKLHQTRVDCSGTKTGSSNSNAGGNNILVFWWETLIFRWETLEMVGDGNQKHPVHRDVSRDICGTTDTSPSIHGIYGFKAESINITKYMQDLTLEDLLNGKCNVARFSRVETRESHNNNKNLLQCVQKICQILPSQSNRSTKNTKSLDTNYNLKGELSISTADKEKVGGEASSPRKEVHNSDPWEVNFKDAVKAGLGPDFLVNRLPLYQPEEFMQNLRISPIESLDSLISQSPIQKINGSKGLPFLNSNTCMVHNSSIPPFSWSLPYCGPCKSVLETCRFSTIQNINARQWIQLSGTQPMNKYCLSNSQSAKFSGLKLESRTKFEGCIDVPDRIPLVQNFVSEAADDRDIKLMKGSSLIDSCYLAEVEKSVGNISSNHHIYRNSKETLDVPEKKPKYNTSCIQATLESEKNKTSTNQFTRDCTTGVADAIIPVPEKLGMVNEEERKVMDGIAPAFSSVISSPGTLHSMLPFHDQNNVPDSPKAQAAAQTLYDMAHCLTHQKKNDQNSAKHKSKDLVSWPGALSQRTAKAHKSINSMGKYSNSKCPEKVEMEEIKTGRGDLTIHNNCLPLERRKCLNQVNDTSTTVKHSASKTGKLQGRMMNVSKHIDEVGISRDTTMLMEGRIFREQAGESTGDLGKGMASLMTTASQETPLKNILTETHARTVRRTIPLTAQKSRTLGRSNFSLGHFSPRGKRGANFGPHQSNIKCRSFRLMGSSSSIQNNDFNTTPKHRKSLSSQQGTRSRDSTREKFNKL